MVSFAIAAAMYDGLLLLTMPASGTLDTRLVYGPDEARDFLTGLSAADHAAYHVLAFADLGFIPVYTALFVTWFRFLRVRGALRLAPALALVPGVFDAIETTSIATALGRGTISGGLAWAMSIATPLKWLAVAAVAVAIVVGELRWFRSWRARRLAVADVDD